MPDEDMRTAIALRRYSIISPIINGQVRSVRSYCAEVSARAIDMPHFGPKTYAPSTIASWYDAYTKGGIDALKPRARSDRGIARVITTEMQDAICAMCARYPKAPATVIYDELIKEGAFLRSEASLSTVRRHIARCGVSGDDERQERLRFSLEHANDLWQTDVMYGPYVLGPDGKRRVPTYLLAYIDDATRLVTHAAFYLAQDICALRNSFREALLRRGMPKALYTDNGRIYRSQAFGYLCAQIKVVLLHTDVRDPAAKGKVERLFRTVRMRCLTRIGKDDLASIEALNTSFGRWLDEDYQRKGHEGLGGTSPLDAFLQQKDGIRLIEDMAAFNEAFLLRAHRTVKKDATFSFFGALYECDLAFAATRVELRWEPEADGSAPGELIIFKDGRPEAHARIVNFHENAHRRRRKPQRKTTAPDCGTEAPALPQEGPNLSKKHTIRYRDRREEGDV
jgi:transposase InsO family protein